MEVFIVLLTGGLAGWLTRIVMRNPQSGVVGDIVLGLLGAMVGGALLRVVGGQQPAGLLGHVVVAMAGAMFLLGAVRLVLHLAERTANYAGVVAAAIPAVNVEQQLKRLGALEHRVISVVLARGRTAADVNRQFEAQLTLGQRVADRVAAFGGSWTFIGLFFVVMLAWMLYNVGTERPFDPFPFILLNLGLSCLAAMQAPVIMMSQNRQAAKDRLEAQNDYEVNLRSELEIMALQARVDELRTKDLAVLVRRQEEILERLARIVDAR